MEFKLIEGFKCYAPELARLNSDFPAESFQKLFEVEENHFWFKSRNNLILHLFSKYVGNLLEKNVLEIGCGTGYVLKGLKDNFDYQLTGAEIHLNGLKFAKERIPSAEFIQFDATAPVFADTFDAIGAFDVLEHIEQDEKVMSNVFRALKPGGFFFISVPQYQWMWSLEDDIGLHKRRYARQELRMKLLRSGFELKFINSFVFTLFPVMVLQRFLGRKRKKSMEAVQGLELPSLINAFFYQLMKIDLWLLRKAIPLPFGGSLVCVAQKKIT